MLSKFRNRMQSEKGFTLIELLVVILIIGILAAIALPAFLGQRAKSQDSGAKSDVRNMISQVESCYAGTQNYADCNSDDAALDDTGLEATVTNGSATGYQVDATSASNNTFRATKTATGVARTCTSAGTDKGGCNASSW